MMVSMTLLGVLLAVAFLSGRFNGVYLSIGWIGCLGVTISAIVLARSTRRLAMFDLDCTAEPIEIVARLCLVPFTTVLLLPIVLFGVNYLVLQLTDLLADRHLGPRFSLAGCMHLTVIFAFPVVMLGTMAGALWQTAFVLTAALLWWRWLQVLAEIRYAERVARCVEAHVVQTVEREPTSTVHG
jgi:hypothetical protein